MATRINSVIPILPTLKAMLTEAGISKESLILSYIVMQDTSVTREEDIRENISMLTQEALVNSWCFEMLIL